MLSEPEPRHLMIKITCGAEAAERANQAWTVAAMGVAAGARVTVWLTGEAVWFAVTGRQPDLALPHASPVADWSRRFVPPVSSWSAPSARPAAS